MPTAETASQGSLIQGNKRCMKRNLVVLVLALFLSVQAYAETFSVSDIRVDGLQRVELGTVLRAFPVKVGERVDQYRLASASRELFATGLFNDIRLLRDGALLIVDVEERPALSRIEIKGNKVIETPALQDGLKSLGLTEGEVFQRATLERIRLELLRLYAAQGRYGAQVEAKIESLAENRVGLTIDIKEGDTATIRHINVVGNRAFADDDLTQLFELQLTGFWDWFSDADRYSREKLSGDLERLRSYYLDRGYINFRVESTQVSISPDRRDVYITINVAEGDRYRFGSFELVGDLILPAERLRSQVTVEPGAFFSRREMVRSADQITRELGGEGYLRANVNPAPQVDEETKTVDIRFFVNPERRVYVRRINFKGNTRTADKVLRREMRQMEAGWASTEKIETSKSRLERLGFFSAVNVETRPVADAEDQIDLEYSVQEQLSGNLSASIGFSQNSGMILAASVSQNNFLGTGNFVSFSINNSSTNTEYAFSYTNPYYTIDGVSRGFRLFFREQDFDEDDVSSFSIDTYGGAVNFGYPIDEYQRLRFELGLENQALTVGDTVPTEIFDFIATEGDEYNLGLLEFSWTDNHLNKGLLATAGYSQSLSLEVALPGSDLSYYKLRYRGQRYFPLTDNWLLSLKSNLGYGDSFGDTSELPFFKNFYAGGFSSVRGFKNNSLGPRSFTTGASGSTVPDSDPDPLGGNILLTGSVELIFPLPFVEDGSKLRSMFFFDAGSVFESSCLASNTTCVENVDPSRVSASVGVGLSWYTFIGPLSFSLAKPVREQASDETEMFQFALGRSF